MGENIGGSVQASTSNPQDGQQEALLMVSGPCDSHQLTKLLILRKMWKILPADKAGRWALLCCRCGGGVHTCKVLGKR